MIVASIMKAIEKVGKDPEGRARVEGGSGGKRKVCILDKPNVKLFESKRDEN